MDEAAQRKERQKRFHQHSTTPECEARMVRLRWACGQLAVHLDELVPEGREKSLATTNLEQVMFWANAGIARADKPA